mgnify:FL=1
MKFKQNVPTLFWILLIFTAIIVITWTSVDIEVNTSTYNDFKVALIEDGKAMYQCDKFGEVTFVIVDTKMAATRDLFKEK